MSNSITSSLQASYIAVPVSSPAPAAKQREDAPVSPQAVPAVEDATKSQERSKSVAHEHQHAEGQDEGGRVGQLSEEEQVVVDSLKERDREVRAHERAHAAAGGQHAGAPSYKYEVGPDGQRYAVAGEVSIDVSPVKGDPEATIQKMQQVIAAAMAPAEPSSQDQAVAAQARAIQQAAQAQARSAPEEQSAVEGAAPDSPQTAGASGVEEENRHIASCLCPSCGAERSYGSGKSGGAVDPSRIQSLFV